MWRLLGDGGGAARLPVLPAGAVAAAVAAGVVAVSVVVAAAVLVEARFLVHKPGRVAKRKK